MHIKVDISAAKAALEAIRHLDEFRATADKIDTTRGYNGGKRVRHWKKNGDRDWGCVEKWWRKRGNVPGQFEEEPGGHAACRQPPTRSCTSETIPKRGR